MTSRKTMLVPAIMLAVVVGAGAQAIPAGAHIPVRFGTELSSATAKVGQTWEGTVARDVVVGGKTVAKAGDRARGTVTAVTPSGRLQHPGVLSVRLTEVNGKPARSAVVTRQAESHKKSNVTKIGGGAAAGAVIGAIAGGGKGAALGTLAGGAAGTGAAAYTGKKEAVIPAESTLTFTTTAGSASSRHKATTTK
jgi:hypothetical protein